MREKNHCKSHGINNCYECSSSNMALQSYVGAENKSLQKRCEQLEALLDRATPYIKRAKKSEDPDDYDCDWSIANGAAANQAKQENKKLRILLKEIALASKGPTK